MPLRRNTLLTLPVGTLFFVALVAGQANGRVELAKQAHVRIERRPVESEHRLDGCGLVLDRMHQQFGLGGKLGLAQARKLIEPRVYRETAGGSEQDQRRLDAG